MNGYTKTELVENLRIQISKSENKSINALMTIYQFQTEEEQLSESTNENNGVGFTGYDAYYLTNLAKWYEEKKFFTPKQKIRIMNSMPKYANQLFNISLSKGLIVKDNTLSGKGKYRIVH